MLNIRATYKPDKLKSYNSPEEESTCCLIEFIRGNTDSMVGSFLAVSSDGQRFFTDFISRFTYEGKGWLE